MEAWIPTGCGVAPRNVLYSTSLILCHVLNSYALYNFFKLFITRNKWILQIAANWEKMELWRHWRGFIILDV